MSSSSKFAGVNWREKGSCCITSLTCIKIEYNCMLFCQVNCATPGDKSLNSPWGPLCRCPSQARTSVTPLSPSHAPHPIETQAVSVSIPKANDIACICLCLHIDFIILYVCSRTWKSSWLLAIISKMWSHPCLAPPIMLWSSLIGPQCDHDSLASASPTLTFVVLF